MKYGNEKHCLIVVLQNNTSEEQADEIKNALECFQDVISVQESLLHNDANICDSSSHVAEKRDRNEIASKLLDYLHNR
tara:strand:- start:308 stop:541 length:234 start_codon:yes stop_codon:yes gene_type:complete